MAIKRALLALGIVTLAWCATGCANCYRAPLKPAPGAFVTMQTIPLTTEFGPTPIAGLNKVSSETFYLWWPYPIMDFGWGDDAKALGKLASAPAYAEVDILTIFGLFGRYTVNIYN